MKLALRNVKEKILKSLEEIQKETNNSEENYFLRETINSLKEDLSPTNSTIYTYDRGIAEILKGIGFKDIEAKIFLLLCINGPLKASKMIDHLNCSRAFVYHSLRKLMDKKLVGKSLLEDKTYFLLERSEPLKSLITEKENELKILKEINIKMKKV